jgi:hypothetical protein
MDIFFFRHTPTPIGEPDPLWPTFAPPESGDDPAPLFQVLHREADPDAPIHDGFDYFAARGDATELQAWAAEQGFEVVTPAALPTPLAYLPEPFLSAATS